MLEGGLVNEKLMGTVHDLLDLLAGAEIEDELAAFLTDGIGRCVAEFKRRMPSDRPKAYDPNAMNLRPGQILCPDFELEHHDETSARASVTFKEYFQGYNMAIHGGAIATLFDQMMGVVANNGAQAVSRTAYLNITFRSVAPVKKKLGVLVATESVDGRKRVIRGELLHEDRVCAEAEGLFIALRPDQQ